MPSENDTNKKPHPGIPPEITRPAHKTDPSVTESAPATAIIPPAGEHTSVTETAQGVSPSQSVAAPAPTLPQMPAVQAGGGATPGVPGVPAGPAPAGMPGVPGGPGGAGAPGGPQGPPPSMFDAMNASRNQLLPEDLPFANEVEAALARKPGLGARGLSLGICVFFIVITIWASQAYVDEVTHAEGQVVSSQRTQSIQNLEGGILREVMVREGEIVEKGTILARLDNEVAESSYRDALNKSLENSVAIIRLQAELEENEPVFPENTEVWLQNSLGIKITPNITRQASDALQDQMAEWRARMQKREAELLMMESQYEQRMHEVEEQSARKRQLDKSLSLTIQQRDIARPLVERGSYSRVDYLRLQQEVVNLQGEVEGLAASIPRAQAAAQEAKQRIAFRKTELNTAITEEISKRRMELASLRETLSAGGDRVTRTELRSPVRGTVVKINLNTVDGVVKPGESIMEVVPLDDTLLVEARVRPQDVAFLRHGQQAMVKITAYDFSIYGGLEGELEQISADTIEDKRGEFFYQVKVRTRETAIHYRGEELSIIPGMMASVDIIIGKKTVLDYLLKPIFKAKQNALRER